MRGGSEYNLSLRVSGSDLGLQSGEDFEFFGLVADDADLGLVVDDDLFGEADFDRLRDGD